MMSVRRLGSIVAAFAVVLAAATPASASHGGSGGGTVSPPTPAIQLAPDTTSLAAGESTFVQVVLSPAAPSGGATLTVTSSPSGALTVPTSVTVPGGSSNAQFSFTANAE